MVPAVHYKKKRHWIQRINSTISAVQGFSLGETEYFTSRSSGLRWAVNWIFRECKYKGVVVVVVAVVVFQNICFRTINVYLYMYICARHNQAVHIQRHHERNHEEKMYMLGSEMAVGLVTA